MHTLPRVAVAAVVATLAVAGCDASTPSSSPSAEPSATATAVPSATPVPQGPEVREPLWEFEVGAEVWATPAALGDLVVVGSDDGVIRALDGGSGGLAWELDAGSPVRATPAATEGAVAVATDAGELMMIEADGSVRWRSEIGSGGERGDYDNYGAAPAVSEGVVYAAFLDGTVAAVDGATGETLWSTSVQGGVQSGLAISDSLVHVSSMGGVHSALDRETGEPVWTKIALGALTTTPAVVGDQVIVGSRSAMMQGMNEATGDLVWATTFGGSWVQSGPVPLEDGVIVVGSSDYRALRALSTEDGAEVWRAPVGGWAWAVPAVADSVVYATELRLDYHLPWDVALHALDASTGEELWVAAGGDALVWAPGGYLSYGNAAGPVIVGDMVVTAGLDGVVRAYAR